MTVVLVFVWVLALSAGFIYFGQHLWLRTNHPACHLAGDWWIEWDGEIYNPEVGDPRYGCGVTDFYRRDSAHRKMEVHLPAEYFEKYPAREPQLELWADDGPLVRVAALFAAVPVVLTAGLLGWHRIRRKPSAGHQHHDVAI